MTEEKTESVVPEQESDAPETDAKLDDTKPKKAKMPKK